MVCQVLHTTHPLLWAVQVGKPLAALPLEPRFGRALLAAADLGCMQEAVAVIALASGSSVFHTPR